MRSARHGSVCLLFLLLVSSVAGQDTPEGDPSALAKGIERLEAMGKSEEAVERAEAFLEQHSGEDSAGRVLGAIARCADRSEELRSRVSALLRRTLDLHPFTSAATEAERAAEWMEGFRFSRVEPKRRYSPKRDVRIYPKRSGRRPATYRIHRIPADSILPAAERDAEGGIRLHESWGPLVPREHWVEVYEAGSVPSIREWSMSLDPGRLPVGLYVLEEEIAGYRKCRTFRVASFAVLARRVGDRTLVWAADLESEYAETGRPLRGVKITGRAGDRNIEGRTDRHGLFPVEDAGKGWVVARRGDEVHLCTLPDWYEDAEEPIYVTTDRPVYRPGHTVQYKAVVRKRDGTKLVLPEGGQVEVMIRDSEWRKVSRETRKLGPHGTLSGSFDLPEEPDLGRWNIIVRAVEGDGAGWGLFRVAAYRKPELRIAVEPITRARPVEGDARFRMRAEYWWGAPAAGAEVSWRVRIARPGWSSSRAGHGYLQVRPFEDPLGWAYRHDAPEEYDWYPCDEIEGEGRTNEDGILEVSLPLPETPGDLRCYFDVEALAQDRFDASVKAEVPVHSAEYSVAAGTTRLFYEPGETVEVRARVTDLDGRPAAGREVEVVAFHGKRLEDTVELEPYRTLRLTAGPDGRVSAEIPAPKPGTLRILGRVRDDAGRIAVSRADVPVAGEPLPGTGEWGFLEEESDEVLVVQGDRTAYRVGETARLLVRVKEPTVHALVTIAGERFHKAYAVELGEIAQVLEIPIEEAFVPNVYVKLVTIDTIGGDEDVVPKAAGFEMLVVPERKDLDVEVTTDRADYEPGDEAKVTVVTRRDGRPVPAEVEISVVDRAVLAVEPDETEDIRDYFRTRHSDEEEHVVCGWMDSGWLSPWGFRTSVTEGHGFGFGEGDSRPDESGTAPARTRKWFPDTAFWAPHVLTGEDGRATVPITMPDSLTTWRVQARGISGADSFGQASGDAVTEKRVALRLAAPRFYTERDRGTVSAVLRSDLSADREFTIRLGVSGGGAGGGEKRVTVPAHAEVRVDFPVEATGPGPVKLRGEALSSEESDALEFEVPVRPYGVQVTAVAAGAVDTELALELTMPEAAQADRAILEVTATSIVGAVREALPWLAEYPYGCTEQTMSRFLPAVAARDAMRRLSIADPDLERKLPRLLATGLARLYDYQHADDGWGWWKYDDSDYGMTVYVVYGLLRAREAGFPVEEKKVLEPALEWLRNRPPTAFGLAVRRLAGDEVGELLALEPEGLEERAWLVAAGREDLAGGLAENLPEGSEPASVRAVAAALGTLAARDRDDPRVGALTARLLKLRRGPIWNSTLDTGWAVMALSAAAGPEKEAVVAVSVNDEPVEDWSRITGAPLRPGKNRILVRKLSGGRVFTSARLRSFDPSPAALARTGGDIEVERRFERYLGIGDGWEEIASGSEVPVGTRLRVLVSVRAPGREYLMAESPLLAGGEARPARAPQRTERWRFGRVILRDDRAAAPARILPDRQSFAYFLRPLLPGLYNSMPATAGSMYDPTHRGRSNAFVLKVVER